MRAAHHHCFPLSFSSTSLNYDILLQLCFVESAAKNKESVKISLSTTVRLNQSCLLSLLDLDEGHCFKDSVTCWTGARG